MDKSLANRLRPQKLSEIIGQDYLCNKNSFLNNSITNNKLFNLILFGPPGCGKSSIAYAYANQLNCNVIFLNAAIIGKKELQDAVNQAKLKINTVLIIDEIHKLNKDKQQFFLPYLENNDLYIIGTTTLNPYYSINEALRSRCYIFEVKQLSNQDIFNALNKALKSKSGLNNEIKLTKSQLEYISNISNGDLRYAYNLLELIHLTFLKKEKISDKDLKEVLKININNFSKDDNYYNVVSGLQKSIRGSDVDASLYYLAILCTLNDLVSIKRRLAITAYEDIGLANPQAVSRTIQALDLAEQVGFPEAIIPLGFIVCELALSPKSKQSTIAIQNAIDYVNNNSFEMPEYLKLRPKLLKDETYPYDRPDLWENIQYLPDKMKDIHFYKPKFDTKFEKALNENYLRLQKIKRSNNIKKLKSS